ncbi:MarR family winged helix-turn-helix transcriptional regulator [Algivirga pacifica]|uniref:HTH marR-type domain-containing protein n=1 Tax=Algivirga pacifica TaxID=1162670 RepID=A0ABP9D822_9BACT
MNFYQDLGALIFGSRLRRLSERFLAEVNKIYQEEGVPFDASWFPVFYLLDQKNHISLIEISDKLEVSHSAISQLISNLEKKGLVQMEKDPDDGRRRLITLTDEGKVMKNQVRKIWVHLQETMDELLTEGEHSKHLLNGLSEIEKSMEERPLYERVLGRME